ncbi:hypothetical protein FHR24_000015 [Wenyingzhuangia heitensis]|uniref:Outer membrane protein beta-barrel domain-containing protein n=1 Tax=Wenyingzhuangia heitensis TaxID=1487859 RepID=A0ABX0U8Y7_9FLAO|nr:hypothetical protein [Wenyingzhuangia heitensis]NIJ43576.1 hypothetical protein [Wenyingzhuangia heitensis]
MRKLLLIICILSSVGVINAQEKKEKKHAVSIGVGTGLGIDYSYKINNYFYATARYSTLPYKKEGFDYEIDGEDMLVDAEFDFSHIDALISIAPFGKAFRFVLGAGYFTSSDVDVMMTFKDEVTIGEVVFTSDDIGSLLINTEWNGLLPYAGISFGRPVPKSGFGFGLELGAYYDADGPSMSLNANGLIENTKNQEGLLQESFKENKFLPYVAFRFAFSF